MPYCSHKTTRPSSTSTTSPAATLADSGQLYGPILQANERRYQRGDRVICLKNDSRLGVLNGDLATVIDVDPKAGALTVRFDRDSEARHLPGWYLDEGNMAHGYALTGHKAQGITVDRTFAVIGNGASREWAYVAMSRGRESNTVYLTCPETAEPSCTHVSHQQRPDQREVDLSSIKRRVQQRAAVEVGIGLR